MTEIRRTLHGVKQAIRKRLGMGNDVQTYVKITLPTDTEVSVGPFVRTEFEEPCSECGEEGHYFHRYMETTGRTHGYRNRCHSCYRDVYGDNLEIPIPIDSPESAEQFVVYDAIDPRELSWPSEDDL